MQNQQSREEDPEIPVLGFMMKQLHAKHTTQATKEGSCQEERFLRHSPLSLLCTTLIVAHQDKGNNVHHDKD